MNRRWVVVASAVGAVLTLTACSNTVEAETPESPDAVAETTTPSQGGTGKPGKPHTTEPTVPPPSTKPPSTNNRVVLSPPAHSGPFDFGKVALGNERTKSYGVQLDAVADPDATIDVTISGSAAFTARETGCKDATRLTDTAELKWHRWCYIEVTFAPLRPGPKSAQLIVSTERATPDIATLNGVGTGRWPPLPSGPAPYSDRPAKPSKR